MKENKSLTCPHCGEKTFSREKKIFDDGFVLKEIKFLCALCGGELQKPGTSGMQEKSSSAASERLSALLGGEKARKFTLEPEEDDGRFCLHCRHYIKHPFMNRCGVTMKEIEATDSCPQFEKKESD